MKWKSIKNEIGFYLFYLLFTCLGVLPFRVLYVISDFLAFVAYRVVGYRKRVVYENLKSSFPEKSDEEIEEIAKKFYRFLADYFFETVKLLFISKKNIEDRMRFENTEVIMQDLRNEKNVTLLLGHYCNWEWISTLPLHLSTEFMGAQIYHPLENESADRIFLKLRNRFGARSIKMASTLRTILGWKKEGLQSVVGYIADQSPLLHDIHLWVDFLNHDTPVITGPERIARKLKSSVYYVEIKRTARGRYEARFVPIAKDASSEPTFDVTRKYFSMLENSIRENPEFWLWSHRRWKRGREDFNDRWRDKAGERLERL